MAKRFAIYPSTVRSQTDGQEHFVSGGRLIELYGLDFRECYIVRRDRGEIIDPDLLPLFPLQHGGYKKYLEQKKANDFRDYVRLRKLFDFHNEGLSPHRHLRQTMTERFRKNVTMHETRWPDYPAAYERMTR